MARFLALAVALLASSAVAFARGDARASFDAGVAAYRAGDFPRARAHWLAALDDSAGDESADDVDRKALLFDLGNAAARAGALGEAVGWYHAALRLAPRDRDALANLEFVRRELGFEPFDKGDLGSTVRRVVDVWTVAEAGWIALGAIAAFFGVLLVEALRGGRAWRRLALLCGAAALVALVPWIRALERERAGALVVIEKGGAALRSEPRADAAAIETLLGGSTVRRLDALPGWVRVTGVENAGGWVREASVFELAR